MLEDLDAMLQARAACSWHCAPAIHAWKTIAPRTIARCAPLLSSCCRLRGPLHGRRREQRLRELHDVSSDEAQLRTRCYSATWGVNRHKLTATVTLGGSNVWSSSSTAHCMHNFKVDNFPALLNGSYQPTWGMRRARKTESDERCDSGETRGRAPNQHIRLSLSLSRITPKPCAMRAPRESNWELSPQDDLRPSYALERQQGPHCA